MDNLLKKRIFFSLLLSLFILFLSGEVLGSYLRGQKLKRSYAMLERRYNDLLRQNQDLQISLTETRSDGFIELMARDKLGLVRPGETAYKIVIEED